MFRRACLASKRNEQDTIWSQSHLFTIPKSSKFDDDRYTNSLPASMTREPAPHSEAESHFYICLISCPKYPLHRYITAADNQSKEPSGKCSILLQLNY